MRKDYLKKDVRTQKNPSTCRNTKIKQLNFNFARLTVNPISHNDFTQKMSYARVEAINQKGFFEEGCVIIKIDGNISEK